ncbi:sulfotransferase 1E1-like [Saccoglossus kowalevskii]|uniref:Estrogen sulfotransferase-like n=1 Tax=Saccoglossus kowalevskii TaxID=10224 RepID=A0ABM0H1C1_SACKO|nr:PREDICTED: estrogen sulfotransferase-like [Saccoglossus kowalevskii]
MTVIGMAATTPEPSQEMAANEAMKPIILPVERIQAIDVREEDVFVITYAKSGTHWMSEIVQTIQHDGKMDMDIFEKRVFIDLKVIEENDDPRLVDAKKAEGASNTKLEDIKSPRVLVSHVKPEYLPKQLHEKKNKIIYVARNPKDVAVSGYKMTSAMKSFIEMPPFEVLAERFFEFTPVDAHGVWSESVIHWWKRRMDDNVLFIKYEDMKRDLKGAVKTVAAFLGKDLSPDVIDKITDHCQIENMKKSAIARKDWFCKHYDMKESPFVRKGKVGGWKDHFTVALNQTFTKKYEELMQGTGLTFDFDLKK